MARPLRIAYPGAFTIALCEAWQNGAFAGTFQDPHKKRYAN
jgi:hypothetical protein